MQLDTSFASSKDAEQILKLTPLVSIPVYKPREQGEEKGDVPARPSFGFDFLALPVVNDRFSAVAEAFRTLRASIQATDESGTQNSILFVSSTLGEGKSFCCVNLAATLAQSGQRILLVDADLRKPVIEERVFSSRGYNGLADYLRGAASFASVIRATTIPNLDAVTAGTFSSDLSDALSAPRLHEFLTEAEPNYDYIIVDSAALTFVPDTLSFARLFPMIFLVIREAKTPRAIVQRSLDLLDRARAKPYGFIMNFSTVSDFDEQEIFDENFESDLDFPKSCPGCGRVYESFEDYFRRTSEPAELPEKNKKSDASPSSQHFSRICECGTPVIVAADNRRDTTSNGLGRRQLFSELHDRLIEAGLPREEARTKLLLTLKIARNEISNEGSSGLSKASVRRRELFDQMVVDLMKSGLSEDDAKAKLLQTIEVWRAAP